MIDQNENEPPVEVGTTTQQPTQQDPNQPAYTQQQYFDAFSRLGLTDKEKMKLMSAQGFDPDSSYTMIMDDYNSRREEMLANIERLEALEKESKKKESTSDSGEEGFESGGTDFGEQAFGDIVTTADPTIILNQRADENIVEAFDLGSRAEEIRELAREEEDLAKKQEMMREARELSAQAHVLNKKASETMNQVFEFNGSDIRIIPESDVDADFMVKSMARRSFEEDQRIKNDFGFIGIESRADLEEYKSLGGEASQEIAGLFGKQVTLDDVREGQWDGSYGLERLWDNAYTTFGAGVTSAAAGLSDVLGGVFGVDSEDNSVARYYRAKAERLNIRNANSRAEGLKELDIKSEYHNMGVLDTAIASFSDTNALKKFLAIDLPDTIGMVFAEAALFMGTRGLGRNARFADKLSKIGKGASSLTVGQRLAQGAGIGIAPSALMYVPRAYEGYLERYPEMPRSSALFYGTITGVAEGMMNSLLLAGGKGSVAATQRAFNLNRAATKASIRKEVSKAIGKRRGSPFLADIGAEGLEEGLVAYTEQLVNQLADIEMGLDPKKVNFHTVADAAFVGLLGGAGPATLSAASSGLSHSSNLKEAQARAEISRRLRNEYEQETDPKRKAAKRAVYAESLQKLKNVKERDVEMYESLDQDQVDELMGVHQEIAQISSDLQKGRFMDGTKITKEERGAMKSRLESLFTTKADIEIKAEAQAFKNSTPDEVKVPDASNQESSAKERTVEDIEKKANDRVPEASEAAPKEVQQEEGQLSMFDENTMDDMVQRKEDPKATAESPTAETKTTDTEMVSEEAAEETAKEKKEDTKAPEAAEVKEDAFELDLAAGQKFDLKDTKVVGEGAGQVPLQVAATVNRMTKSFGKAISAAGAKLKAHRTMESFMSLNKSARNQKGYLEVAGEGGQIQGYFDPRTNTIHLNPLSDSMDVMEEIGHLVLSPVIGKNAKARETLYKEMEQIAKGRSLGAKNVKKIIEQTKKDYGNKSLSTQQEEAIISVLVNYANNPSVFSGVENRIIKAINKIAKAAGFKKNIISGKEGLFKLAEKFKKASEGVETEVAVEDAPTAEAPAAEAETTVPSEEKLDYEQTDNKGRKFTYFKKSKTKDGVTTTKFSFNRSDKGSEQRSKASVPIETALGGKFTINEDTVPEGSTVVGVREIRVGEDGRSAASVVFETDGNRFNGDVTLNPTTKEKAPAAEAETTLPSEQKLDYEITDTKGRTSTHFSKTQTKDGVTTTKFSFNRSDKSAEQRGSASVPVEVALGDKFTIDQEGLPEGATIVGVKEVREVADRDEASATVVFEQDGNRFEGEVTLNPTTKEKAPAAEEAQEAKEEVREPKVKKKTPPSQEVTTRFYNRVLSSIKGLTEMTISEDENTANSDTAKDRTVRAGRTLRGLMMRGERIFAEYENDITAQELKSGERQEGIFYYDSKHSRTPKKGPKFLKRDWNRSNFGPDVTKKMIGGYQVTARPDGKGGYTYELYMASDVDAKMGQKLSMDATFVLEAGGKENNFNSVTAGSLDQFQALFQKEQTERARIFADPNSTTKQKRQANIRVQNVENARDVVLQVHETIKNPSRAAEGRQEIKDHANEVARRVSRILASDKVFQSEFAKATTALSLVPPTTDQKVEAFMQFLNKSSFWGWGEGKGLGDRPHSGDVLRTELSNEIDLERSKDVSTAAQDIRKDETLSEDQKNKALEEITNDLLVNTEGISTPEGDALDQAQDISSVEGMMSVRRKKEFNYLKDTEIFYESHPYLSAGQSSMTSSRYTSFRVTRSIRVNDYFHFRNWYNKTTGNQRADRIQNMYFIKDGKKYSIKPPRPKVDSNGKPVFMEVPLNPQQRRRQEAFDEQDRGMELRERAAALKDETRALFRQLPWGGYVNSLMFEPESRPQFEKVSPDIDYRLALIGKKNLEAAINMGLTKEDIERRLDDSGRRKVAQALNRVQDGDIVNATGLKLSEEAGDGDNVGMFSVRSKFELETAERKGLIKAAKVITDSVRSFFGKTEEGSLAELAELVGVMIMGYDRTGKRRKGITSGVVALLGLPDNVLSTHVNVQTARLKLNQLKNRAVDHYLETGNLKGNLGIGFSILNPEATLGNPDVFIEYMNGIETLIKNGDLAPSDFLSNKTGIGINATAIPSVRYALSAESNLGNSVASDVLNDIIIPRQDGSYLIMDADLTKEHVLGIIDALKKHHKNFPDSFSSRKKLFSSNLTHSWLNSLNAEGETMKFEDRVSSYYNDSALEGTESATLQAYKSFPYELEVIEKPVEKKNKDGKVVLVGGTYKLKGARVESDPSLGFGGKIVLDKPSKMKHMKKLYRLEDIDPDFEYKSTTKEKAEKGEMTPRDVALTANQRSLYEFNQAKQDTDISDTSEDGPFSVRRPGGFRTVNTDQGSWKMRELNGFQRWRNKWIRRLQDKYIDIFQLQEDVEAARGRRAADQDFRMAEELMYGKAAEDLNKLDEKVDSLTDLIKEKGFTVKEISDYIYALHAKERNALIDERTEGEEKDGSGMSNARADEIIASFQNKQQDVKDIISLIRDIQQDTRDTMVKFGLESQETIDAFEAQFDNYVPLSGIAIDEETSVTSAYPTGGAGMSVYGPTTKRAEGRKSEATNILAQIIAQNASVHIKARTNEALQSLYNLVSENPNKDVWRILDGKDVNSQDPHIVSVRVNGEQKYIRFKDASYAETLRNMNLPQTNFFIKMLRAPSNWLRRSFTTLNPEFMISNFSRDIQAAMFNAAAEADIEGGLIEGKGIVAEMLKLTPKTLKVLMRAESPRAMKTLFAENPELERYYQDFKDDGGKTGWSYAKPLDQIASELEKKSSDKNALQSMLGKAQNFAEVIEGYNDAFENSIRLSSYIAARKNGVSREKAAQMAKNITVNFNKSGEYGQLLNSVYLFFNASVQGSFRLGKSLLTMKPPTYPDGTKREFKDRFNNAQKMAAALTVFSGMAAMLALAMSDEDEDGELYYNKIPDYIKERNLIFMRPNGKDYFKIPLPYGFSMFANLGTAAVEVGSGHKEIDTAMMQMVSSFMNSFSPISFGQSRDLFTKAGKSAVPTVFKPLVDVMTNETYFGGPVFSENLPYGLQRPESSLSFRSPESVKSFFRWMNEATGGSVDVKGDLDFNPDKMYYIFEYFIGGAGKFVSRTGDVAMGLKAKAEDNDFKLEANDIPFMRILYGEPSKYMDMEDYRSRRQEVMQLYKELKNSPRTDKPGRYLGIRNLNDALKRYDKILENLRKAKRNALNIDDYTERMIRIQNIRDKERKIVMQFNKYYEQVRKK